MADAKGKGPEQGGAAPKKAASPPKVVGLLAPVSVKNISGKLVNTTFGPIKPGDKGKATAAECHTYSKYLEKA